MQFKAGVNPKDVQPELIIALIVAEGVWADLGYELTITSLNDSWHSENSLHYLGRAADLRTWFDSTGHQWAYALKMEAKQRLEMALGHNEDYDIVIEGTHIHIEYDPK